MEVDEVNINKSEQSVKKEEKGGIFDDAEEGKVASDIGSSQVLTFCSFGSFRGF